LFVLSFNIADKRFLLSPLTIAPELTQAVVADKFQKALEGSRKLWKVRESSGRFQKALEGFR
jgi:hypothetical protein